MDAYDNTLDRQTAAFARDEEEADVRVGADSWVTHGILSGALGAVTVAVFFLIIDSIAGQPLRTPGMLGAAVFLGESGIASGAGGLAAVVGYTLIHGGVFVAIGLLAAFETMTGQRLRLTGKGLGLFLTAGFFAYFQTVFLAFAALFAPALTQQFGIGLVALANLLAAAVMAVHLVRQAR